MDALAKRLLTVAAVAVLCAGGAFAQDDEGDGAASDSEPAAVAPASEKPSADAGSSEKTFRYVHGFGARISLGMVYDFELNLQYGLGQKNRLEFGLNAGIGISNDVLYVGYGFSGAYQWRFPVTNDGFFAWYAGPAISVGHYAATDLIEGGKGLLLGIGGQVGVEFNFGNLIKSEGWHPFKYWQFSVDARPEINVVKPHKDLWFLPAIAIASRRMF